jgi:hypothetical protein
MTANGKIVVDYNVQVAVDARNELIVEQAVNNSTDMGLLKETAEPARAMSAWADSCEPTAPTVTNTQPPREPNLGSSG